MQVIAIENGNMLSSIKYHRSDKKTFATYDPDYFEEENTIDDIGEDLKGDVGVENLDTELRTLLDKETHSQRKEKKEEEKGFLEKHFFLVIVGGCLAGIVLVIVLVSIILSLRGKICKKGRQTDEEDEEPEDVPAPVMTRDGNLSKREQRVLSLFMKSSK